MWKRALFLTVFFFSACVTVNIYFPAAAVERAADQIVKETWGGPSDANKAPASPQSRRAAPESLQISLSFVPSAHAQEADINISNPAIRDAVANATFELLVGFQLTDAQLRYNATR